MSSFFGGLSAISSLDSDDRSLNSDAISAQTQDMELLARLKELEAMTSNFLLDRPIVLTHDHDSFTEIERSRVQDFELRIERFGPGDVLAVSILCLPDCITDDVETMLEGDFINACVDHQRLLITMTRINPYGAGLDIKEASNVTKDVFKPSLHNGEYTFTLTMAHGITEGSYMLSICHDDVSGDGSYKTYQSIRVSHKVYASVRAVPLECDKPQQGRVGNSEFEYYRFFNKDPTKLLSISVRALHDENGPIGDPDLLVTNKYDGLVGVTKDNYTWNSRGVGSDRVDIHPADVNATRGNFFIIGVLGYRDRNDFEILVTQRDAPPIQDVDVEQSLEMVLSPGEYSYFRLRVDPRRQDKIVLMISGMDPRRHHSSASKNLKMQEENMEQPDLNTIDLGAVERGYGRAVYTSDTLASSGLLLLQNTDASFAAVLNSSQALGEMPSIISAQRDRQGSPRPGSPSGANMAPITAAAAGGGRSSIIDAASPWRLADRLSSVATPQRDGGRLLWEDLASGSAAWTGLRPYAPYTDSRLGPGGSPQERHLLQSPENAAGAGGHLKVTPDYMLAPPSAAARCGLFPVVFLTASGMYPCADNYTWRASADDGRVLVLIEPEEWKYSSGICYFSVYGLDLSGHPAFFQPQSVAAAAAASDEADDGDNKGALGDTAATVARGEAVAPSRESREQWGAPPRDEYAVTAAFPRQQPDGYWQGQGLPLDGQMIGAAAEIERDWISDEGHSRVVHPAYAESSDASMCGPTSAAVGDDAGATGAARQLRCVIRAQPRKDPDLLSVDSRCRHGVYERIFRAIDGASASQKDRVEMRLDDPSYTYGEVDYASFQLLLRSAGLEDGMIFYDLGCGSGKALIAAAFSDIRFLRCIGIELLPSLCAQASQAVELARSAILGRELPPSPPILPPSGPAGTIGGPGGLSRPAPAAGESAAAAAAGVVQTQAELAALTKLQAAMPLLEVREGSLLDDTWSDADVVFVSSLCFSEQLLQGLLTKAANLKRGSRLLSLRLPDGYEDLFRLTGWAWIRMTWGRTKIFLLIRK